MKKWHTVLWIVFASLGLSGVSFFMFRQKHWSEMTVAKVNGYPVYFDEYRRVLVEVQERVNQLRPLARMYGMSEEMFLSAFLGVTNPEELALETCIKDKLFDYIEHPFNITLDKKWFQNELIKAMPQLTDENGRINMDMYQHYLERLSMTPAEYERRRKAEFQRGVINQFIQGSTYIPGFITREAFNEAHVAKSFAVIEFPYQHFLNQVKKEAVDDKTLDAFYIGHNDEYKIPEQRKARYWEMTPEMFGQKIDVDEATIKNFYDKHKTNLYRISPKIKVRHIFIKASTPQAREKIHTLYDQAVKAPNKFAELAKQHSEDTATAKSGGVIDFFSKGTKDTDFERAAFRLHTENAISPIIKTKQGYEIIQLVSRIAASAKPFDSVKDDIAKTIRAKRSLTAVRSELETLTRSMREDAKALDRFVERYHAKTKETDLMTEQDSNRSGIEAQLARHLFSPHKRQSTFGYFVEKDVYVLYQLAEVKKSYIPAFKDIKGKVMDDFYAAKTEALAKNSLKDARAAILAKKMTLEQFAEQQGRKVIKTTNVRKNDTIPELKINPAIKEKMFMLSDPSQVLEFKDKDTFYLAQVRDMQAPKDAISDQERSKIIKQEKYKANMQHLSAFIASLYRNATIETDKAILEKQRQSMKD